MELENDLKRLRFAGAPAALRARVLRGTRSAAPRTRLAPPWFTPMERHWLYPGRAATVAVVIAWLVIASLRFATPASLVPISGPLSRLNADDLARIEVKRARLLAELRDSEVVPPTPTFNLPPRS